MTAQVLSFFRRPAAPRDWSPQELAEFYRVESALIQAGLRVTSARGLTDEDEPWFVFCRAEDDDVIIHFARIGGRYVISAPAYCGNVSGPDFATLVRGVIERQPLLQPRPSGNNLFLHPAALLVMLVASALLKSGHAAEAAPAKAADAAEAKSRGVAPTGTPIGTPTGAHVPAAGETTAPEAQHELLILAAITAAIAPLAEAAPVTIVVTAPAHPPAFVDQPAEPSAGPTLLDLPRDIAAQGAGSTTPSVSQLQSVAALPAEATPATLMHTAHAPDAASVMVLPSAAMQTALLSDALPAPTSPTFTVPPDPAAGAQELPLFAISGIPKADLDLLHMLGVADTVAYSATPPVVFATVLQTGTNAEVTVTTTAAGSAASAGGATDTDVAAVHSTAETAAAVHPTAETAVHSTAEPVAAAPAAAVEPAAVEPAAAADSTAPAATTTVDHAAAAPAAAAAEPAVVEPAAAAPAAVEPAAAAPVAAPPAAAAAPPNLSAVLAAVEQFQLYEIHPVVLMTAHSAIFYDAAAVDGSLGAVKSVTYDFGDGFSISLIGLPSELAHAGVHV